MAKGWIKNPLHELSQNHAGILNKISSQLSPVPPPYVFFPLFHSEYKKFTWQEEIKLLILFANCMHNEGAIEADKRRGRKVHNQMQSVTFLLYGNFSSQKKRVYEKKAIARLSFFHHHRKFHIHVKFLCLKERKKKVVCIIYFHDNMFIMHEEKVWRQ